MKLTDYLREKRMTAAEFADLIGVDKSTATRWENGDTTPRPRQMACIIEKTDGAVTANDFVPAVPEPAERRPRTSGRAAA